MKKGTHRKPQTEASFFVIPYQQEKQEVLQESVNNVLEASKREREMFEVIRRDIEVENFVIPADEQPIEKNLPMAMMMVSRYVNSFFRNHGRMLQYYTSIVDVPEWCWPINITEKFCSVTVLRWDQQSNEKQRAMIGNMIRFAMEYRETNGLRLEEYRHYFDTSKEEKNDEKIVQSDVVLCIPTIQLPETLNEKKCVSTAVVISASMSYADVEHVLQFCSCYCENGKTVSEVGGKGDVWFCPEGFYVGCMESIQLSPRYYLTSSYRINIPEVKYQVDINTFVTGAYKKIIKLGSIKIYGKDNIFVVPHLRMFKGTISFDDSWSEDVYKYICAKYKIQYNRTTEQNVVRIDLNNVLMHKRLNYSYLRYPMFEYYRLDSKYVKTYITISGRDNVVNLYGIPSHRVMQIDYQYDKSHILSGYIGMHLWFKGTVETSSSYDVSVFGKITCVVLRREQLLKFVYCLVRKHKKIRYEYYINVVT